MQLTILCIQAESLLATPVSERWPAETSLEAEWNRVVMNGDVLKVLSRTMEDILNTFSNNLNDFTVH